VSLVAISGCGGGAPKEIPIGSLLSLSGMAKSDGEQARHGIEMAVRELNTGEFHDSPIRIVETDSGSDATRAVDAFRRMSAGGKLAAVIAAVSSDEVLACAPVANLSKVVLLSTTASSDDIRHAGDYVFRNMGSAGGESAAVARHIADRFPGKGVVVLHSDRAYGVSYRDAFVNAFVGRGPIPATIAYPSGRESFREEVARIKAGAAAAVFVIGNDAEIAAVAKQLRAAGVGTPLYAAGIVSEAIPAQGGAATEGLIAVIPAFNAATVQAPNAQAFVAAYRNRYGEDPTYAAANSYDAVRLLGPMIKRGAKDGDAVRAELYRTIGFPALSGNLSFDKDGEVDTPPTLVEVQGGKFRALR
jgi:branched-chain amino acid transport system substrate-binding protein